MTLRQAKWAEQHDWFIRYEPVGHGNWQVVTRPDLGEHGLQRFTDFAELKAWAGY